VSDDGVEQFGPAGAPYQLTVDQEVGGSSPPSCTSEINSLEAKLRRSFQDRYHLATTASALRFATHFLGDSAPKKKRGPLATLAYHHAMEPVKAPPLGAPATDTTCETLCGLTNINGSLKLKTAAAI
jgi:hypothetical protein